MKRLKLITPECWEVVLFLMSAFIIYFSKDYESKAYKLSVLVGIATCIMTAILILYIQRTSRRFTLYNYYKKIAGNYIRIKMGQDNTDENDNRKVKEGNIGLKIDLQYDEENRFNAVIEYWKDENKNTAKALASLEFSEINKKIASGTYQYFEGKDFINHFGTLELFLLEKEPDKINVRYQHVFPRETENNPDKNRGWEIWQKENQSSR